MLNVGIITISDKGAQGQRYDKSGEVIRDVLSPLDNHVVKYEVIPDELDIIASKLAEWADEDNIDVIILDFGGSGIDGDGRHLAGRLLPGPQGHSRHRRSSGCGCGRGAQFHRQGLCRD